MSEIERDDGVGRLRILHLAHVRWFNAEVQYALDLAEMMQRRGHGTALLAQRGSPAVGHARAAGVEVMEEGGFNAKGLGVLGAVPAAIRLARLLKQRTFDAVEVHRPEGLPLVVWACRHLGVPVIRVRGDMRSVRRDPLNRYLHTRAISALVASNSTIAALLRRRLGTAARVSTIHGGVDPEVFSPTGGRTDVRLAAGLRAGHGPLVGILGRLGPVKGHEDFLRAARRVLDAGVNADFVVLAKAMTARAAQLRAIVEGDAVLRGRVGFLGYCDDLPSVLRSFDVGVVASVGSEANCRVGLEWMASGVPLVATRVGVLPDLVEHGRTGFLVTTGDADALAIAIMELTKDRGKARCQGDDARKRVLARFTLNHCAVAHEQLISSVLPGRDGCRRVTKTR